MPAGESSDARTGDLRSRLAAAIAAGRTVVLTADDLADPALPDRLPDLLHEARCGDGASREGTDRIGPPTAALRVPGYTVLGEVARGGMSTVYLARHDALARSVALKITTRRDEDGTRARQRILREARAMARVAHPNIVTIHDVIELDDEVAIAMEWVDGSTLAQLLRALPGKPGSNDPSVVARHLGALPPALARPDASVRNWLVQSVRDIALALDAVHHAGLLHLDVKPSNILLRRDGTPLLADFGVVREIDLQQTRSNSFAGTPIYAAPEQIARAKGRLGPTTDVYALGLTLYESLARRRAIDESSLSTMLRDLEVGRVPRLSTRCEVPTDLENIVHRAIDPDPTRRYPSAAAFAADLDAFLAGRPVSARPLGPFERFRRRVRAEPWKAFAAAILLVLLPTAAVLAVKLAIEWPVIQATREADVRREGVRILQMIYLDIDNLESLVSLQRLEDLLGTDSRDGLLVACGAAMAAYRNFEHAVRFLDRHPGLVERHLGLRLLRERCRTSRRSFSDAETAQLADSRDPIDVCTLAVDRVVWLKHGVPVELLRDAIQHIDRAILFTGGAEPLFFGLKALLTHQWTEKEFEDTIAAIEARWPDDPVANAWIAMAQRDTAAESSLERLRDLVAKNPDEPFFAHMLVDALIRRKLYAEAVALAEQRLPPTTQDRTRFFHFRATGRHEDAAAAKERLLANPDVSPISKYTLLMEEQPEAARPHLRDACSDPVVNVRDLSFLHNKASAPEDLALTEAAIERTLGQQLPAWLVPRLLQNYVPKGKAAHGAELLTRYAPFEVQPATSMLLSLELLRSARMWPELERAARRLDAIAESDRQRSVARFHIGIARSRMGDGDAAKAAIEEHLRLGGRTVYREAFVELAWLMVDPTRPAAQRDPKKALHLCERLESGLQQLQAPARRGAWWALVHAEAEFANGDPAAAVRCATEAKEVSAMTAQERKAAGIRDEWNAPDDLAVRIESALTRYAAAASTESRR